MTIAKWVRDGYAQKLKKPPIKLGADGLGGIQLGTLLEIESLRDFQFRWRKHKPKLIWSLYLKSLIFVDIPGHALGAKEKTASEPFPDDMPTFPLFKGFHGREPKKITSYRLKTRGSQWITFGSVTRIDYQSTRNGEKKSYTHKHATGVQLYRLGEDTGPTLWVVRGGKLSVTARGIIH